MDDTAWDDYGVGNYEKCADCMVHSGFEATAVTDSFRRPLEALRVMTGGVRTQGPMAPEVSFENQRPAKYMFSRHVEQKLEDIAREDSETAAARRHLPAAE